ncbi:MAG TPA: anaerobic ribonucleoside-triphosphate reductase, partial [Elusimicrobiales bacterium]|nr:anaerobic ribonucleoside-triphosphate reductase [Elusimicrobiales bacterium]
GADVSIIDRIELQSKFHDMIESGSIIHVYCGESLIPAESIAALVERTYRNTRASQITISPEFTHCNNCHTNFFGFKDKCGKCGSENVSKRTKIVGYFSNLGGWNDSQLEISRAREAVADRYASFAPGVPWLYQKDPSKKIMVFGKSGCGMCEEAKSSLARALRSKGLNVPVEFHDLQTQESRMAAARYNVPLDPIPTVLVKNNGTMDRYELEFRRGKPLHRKEVEYARMVEEAFTVKV